MNWCSDYYNSQRWKAVACDSPACKACNQCMTPPPTSAPTAPTTSPTSAPTAPTSKPTPAPTAQCVGDSNSYKTTQGFDCSHFSPPRVGWYSSPDMAMYHTRMCMDLFDANGLTPMMACPECGFCSVPFATSSVKAKTVLVKKNPMDATVTAEEELEIRPELGLEIQSELGR
eukprot:UN03564